MDITRAGTAPSRPAPSEYFSGTVRLDSPFTAGGQLSGVTVTFEPGARTHWHTHPLGQTLIIVSGHGRAQREGGPVEDLRPGDIVWFPPGEKHWHGAAADCAMTHIAIAGIEAGAAVHWLEPVASSA